MKNSASIIAESLTEFGRLLRETEIPNDVETTEQILEAQKMERDAIKVLKFIHLLGPFKIIQIFMNFTAPSLTEVIRK